MIVLFAAAGVQERSRRCDSPKPQHKGRQCQGERTETAPCFAQLRLRLRQYVSYDYLDSFCEGQWQEWTPWSRCSKSCDGGSRSRKRKCNENSCLSMTNSHGTDGSDVEIDHNCNSHKCPRKYLRSLATVHCMSSLLAEDARLGEWSPWTCNSECYRPGEKFKGYVHFFLNQTF